MKIALYILVLVMSLNALADTSATNAAPKIVSRMYHLRPDSVKHVAALVRDKDEDSPWLKPLSTAEWKEFFDKMDVFSWPDESDITYHSEIDRLVARNTVENLSKIERILYVGPHPMMESEFEIELRFIAFDKKDILSIDRTMSVTTGTLLALRQAGKGELLAAPVVRTPSGLEATTKSVTEYIYPTAFMVSPITTGGTNSNDVARIIGAVVEPQDFQMREVGVILSVHANFLPDSRSVHLILNPEISFETTWKDYGSEYPTPEGTIAKLPMQQPIFRTIAFQTSISVPNNTFVLLSGGSPAPDGDKIIYALVRARIIDIAGNVLGDEKSSIDPGENTSTPE
jgi:hypothetical protein